MNVLLKPELEQFVATKIKAGQFADASQIVNEALEVLRDQEQFTPEHESYFRHEVRRGLDQLDEGHHENFDAVQIIVEERARLGGDTTA